MKIDAPNLNHLWAQLLIEELIRNGVTRFFVAPGSRSAPLALAVAHRAHDATAARRHKRGDVAPPSLHTHFDERGLAFAALGCARATGVPAAVITTSGTAVANLLPAVIEASMERVPMILLTADRPPELRDCGANQSIDQVGIFGGYVRWFFDVPCPDGRISPRFVLTTVDHAVARAASGPVHLNCAFREPLAPSREAFDRKGVDADIRAWRKSGAPLTVHASPSRRTSFGPLLEVLRRRKKLRGLILAAGLPRSADAEAVRELAAAAGWPVLADIRSGVGDAIGRADQLLLSAKFARRFLPEVVLQFGARPVSKRIQEWLDRSRPGVYAVVSDGADRLDAGLCVTHRWPADAAWACRTLRPVLRDTGNAAWLRRWQAADRTALSEIADTLGRHPLSEPWIANAVTLFSPPGQRLVFASSMPVRDAEMYGVRGDVAATANRGASGIDGTIATAYGVAVGAGAPVTVVTGDLSLLHDLNSLALFRAASRPFVIVAINNDGGAIFSFLPVAKFPQHFEEVFATPHGLGFAKAAEVFGIAYENPTTAKAFESAYRSACQLNGATLIEVRTNREENLRIHREMQDAVRKAVDRGH